MITEITLSQIQEFIVTAVATSAEYDALSNSITGSSTNFYVGSDLRREAEELPYFIGFKFNSQDVEGDASSWTVQYIIAIDGQSEPVVDGNGITSYSDSSDVESLAVKALDIITKGL